MSRDSNKWEHITLEELSRWRVARGLTVERAAQILGVSTKAWYRWRAGHAPNTSTQLRARDLVYPQSELIARRLHEDPELRAAVEVALAARDKNNSLGAVMTRLHVTNTRPPAVAATR